MTQGRWIGPALTQRAVRDSGGSLAGEELSGVSLGISLHATILRSLL